jgi:hypothetical protein
MGKKNVAKNEFPMMKVDGVDFPALLQNVDMSKGDFVNLVMSELKMEFEKKLIDLKAQRKQVSDVLAPSLKKLGESLEKTFVANGNEKLASLKKKLEQASGLKLEVFFSMPSFFLETKTKKQVLSLLNPNNSAYTIRNKDGDMNNFYYDISHND